MGSKQSGTKTSGKKPKITMVVFGFPSPSETFISLTIAELYTRGCNVRVLNLDKSRDIKWAPASLQHVANKLAVISVKYYNTKNSFLRSLHFTRVFFANSLYRPLSSLRLLLHKIFSYNAVDFIRTHNDAFLFRKCNDSDIIHCQSAVLADRLIRLERYGFQKFKAALVCSIRGADITMQYHLEKTDWNALFARFDLFLPVCNYFLKILKKMGCGKKITIVHSPVNTLVLNSPKQDDTSSEKAVKIISVGRLVEKKGLDDAINAIHLINKSSGPITYEIIGDGPLYNDLKTKIHEYEPDNTIALSGALPSNQTLTIMADSDILLAPSKTAANGDSEGIPNVVKEAMLLGLQVVSTRHAGIPEIIEHGVTGFLAPENDPEVLADILDDLIKNRTGWSERSGKAKAFASYMFSVEKTTNELIEAYGSLLKNDFQNQ